MWSQFCAHAQVIAADVGTMAGCCSRWTLPTFLWSLLSLASAALCSLGLYFSNWLQRETEDGTINSVSSFRLCLNESSQISASCDSYFTFGEMFSTEWQAVTVLMGLGACVLVFTGLISLFALCVHRFCNKCLVCAIAVLQCLGGQFVVGGYYDLRTHNKLQHRTLFFVIMLC